ncbi:MAG: ester cyclase [Roseateles depolymerans]|uniref:Ester cyclase n=1 Tax=Roseateles depolymerans TaxID=76731 RepID=A0A2W5DDQ1_9BURK|nr:MAG: ester cyclase [Roseateles depolymerans]
MTRTYRSSLAALAVVPLLCGPVALAAQPAALLQPQVLVADRSLPAAQQQSQVLAARRYGSFWASGDEALARAALAPDFMDRTLPPGRAQGVEGPIAASRGFRAAVPDLTARIEQMLVTGDRVVVHLRFSGHFSGEFQGRRGAGQAVDFIATDIYRIAEGRIAENWHLEDNLTLMQQLGLVAR